MTCITSVEHAQNIALNISNDKVRSANSGENPEIYDLGLRQD